MTRSIVAEEPVYDAATHTLKSEQKPPDINKAKDYVGFMAAALPVVGAVGTVFVWIFSAVYVGNVDLTSKKPFREIFVQVFNEKGNESEFHSPRFQLMPGDYVLRISLDKSMPVQYGCIVKFHEKTTLPLEDPSASTINPESDSDSDDQTGDLRPKKRWWQFWRK